MNDQHKEGTRNGKIPGSAKKGKRKPGKNMAAYVKAMIPSGAVLDFVFKEDFDGDGKGEGIVGFTEFTPFPPESSVVYIKNGPEGFVHEDLFIHANEPGLCSYGITDEAVLEDVNGDGTKELVLSMAAGNSHNLTVLVFQWKDGAFLPVWRSKETCFHGSMEVTDINGTGSYGIIIDTGTMDGAEILSLGEACFHVRKSCLFKWDGTNYTRGPHSVRMPYLSYNAAVKFLLYIWMKEYRKAYEMVIMPAFLGLDGLGDSSCRAFTRYLEKSIRPALERNIDKGKLIPAEPYDTYCTFYGPEDDFSIELVRRDQQVKIRGLNIFKKPRN